MIAAERLVPTPMTIEQIRHKVRVVLADESAFAALSTGEKLAVAFVLERYEWVKDWGTMLEAAHRLGMDWLEAALYVQRNGWQQVNG
jgi:hypothetical protein